MKRIAKHGVYELIAEFGLHEGTPVDVTRLEGRFVPEAVDLAGAGVPACVLPPIGESVTDTTPAIILLDRGVTGRYRRMRYCHEIGHVLCGHAGSARLIHAGDWFHDRAEREAWEAAALILIPSEAWEWDDTKEAVAATCDVDPWLVDYWPGLG